MAEVAERKPLIGNDWDGILAEAFSSDWYKELRDRLKAELATKTVYPPMHDIYKTLRLTPYKDAKVVILGQDPYHGYNEANGLAFSVNPLVPFPPSLRNIFKELTADLGCHMPNHGNLTAWSSQGVLLLNTVLTVRKDEPLSHRTLGWQQLTDEIISALNRREDPVIFVLWGTHAKEKRALITAKRHYVVTSAHPSPLSAHNGFFGSRPFSAVNEILIGLGKTPIDWQIQNI